MEGLKSCFMTCQLKSDYHRWIADYVSASGFSIAPQNLELLAIVPQKKCVPHGILMSFFTEYRYSYLRFESMLKTWVTKKKPRKLGMSGPAVRTPVKRQRSEPSEPSSPVKGLQDTVNQNLMVGEMRRWRCRASFQTPSKKFKGNLRYTGSDNEDDDFNDFTMNKGFIQYN